MALADRDALEALFGSTGGVKWKTMGNWSTDAELSKWDQVKVDEDGRVVGLLLSRNILRGPIPEALGALTNMVNLHLNWNQLHGPIPEVLGTLTNMANLHLGWNQLKGPIPEVLGALTNMRGLDLGHNQLLGPIPEALGALTNLSELLLAHNQLSGPIPEALRALTKLTKLFLGHNKLTGPIPEALGALTNVTNLRLCKNQLKGPIPLALGALTDLTELDLSINKLTGPIPEALKALTKLTKLGLNNNQLAGPIPDALGALTSMRNLDLRGNQLAGPIPEALRALINLEHLFLGHNQLTGPIPEAIFEGAFGKLTKLHLSGNPLTGPIPEALGTLTNLLSLHLTDNQLTGAIPDALGGLTKLTKLFLGGNQLAGTVPASVWKLPCTRKVVLDANLLTRFTDPEAKATSMRVFLDCMERLERRSAAGLVTSGNPWEFPPAAVVAKGWESIRRYYDTWEQCDFSLVEIHALKVVVVGAYGAGKTSLARSIKMGRGDRTPEVDENTRTTVGVDLHSHKLGNGTECKIYDVAGQITYYGLHQFFLTERAVYLMVSDVTKFEGLSGEDLDEAIEENILEWVSLLHMRTPLCTVVLVASHYDMLHGTIEENEKLLVTVERRFLELHKKWKSLRHHQNSNMDERMTILPGVFPVGCKLESESASYSARDGLRALDEALSKQAAVVSLVPPSWVAARQVLEKVGNARDDAAGGPTAVGGRHRPWELRSVIHFAFKGFVEEGRRDASRGGGQQHPASFLWRLKDDGIRYSMDGAIELRAFSGTVISHDVFVVLDVMWLACVLKPILDHRDITKNEMGDKVYADRVLGTSELIRWASELVGRGVLRRGFARLLWSLREHVAEREVNPVEMEPTMFEGILERIGVVIPLPVGDNSESSNPAAEGIKLREDSVHESSRHGSADLLVIMRLPLKADAKTRTNLTMARQAALPDSGDGNSGLKAVFEFDHAGAPHGLPERVMAESHKIGAFSSRARWRLGGLFLLHSHGISGASSIILEYDKKSKTLCIEALGQSAAHIQAVQFVISALYHVARDFPGASWTGWMECGMSHEGEQMYILATSNQKENQKPGSEVIPLTRHSKTDKWRKQRNMCGMQGFEAKGSCTLDPDVFGRVLDVTQSVTITDEAEARCGGVHGRNMNDDSSTTAQKLVQMAGELTEMNKNMVQVKGGMHRVEGGMERVEGGIDRVEEGIQKVETDLQRIARGTQESLLRLKNLQAPNYPYPHLVDVREIQSEGKRGLWRRLRGVFVMDMTLHFLCPLDMSKVPCGLGGNGYRLHKTRAWVKKISPALQVTLVTAKVALKGLAGVEVPGLSGFIQDVGMGFAEELHVVDRTLDEDVLLRVLSGDEDVQNDMQRKTRASYEAITEFMKTEELKRRKNPRKNGGYIDFRNTMQQVVGEEGRLTWVRTENVPKWKDLLPAAAPPWT